MRTLSALLVLITLSILSLQAQAPSSDDALYDQVRLKLTRDRDVGSANIDVKVKNGVVELTGTVKRDQIKLKAEKIARKVKGVQQVVNSLKVGPAPAS